MLVTLSLFHTKMKTSYLVILTFMFFHRFLLISNTIMITSYSNVTCIERERQALLVVKRTLTDKFNLLSTWRGVECCDWQGVGCNSRSGHVIKLDLRSPVSFIGEVLDCDKWLEGPLSPSLQNLKHLSYLDLSMNDFSGNIPEFLGSFERLEYLNLSRSGFQGLVPHHLGNLSRLQYLDLKNSFVLDDQYNVRSIFLFSPDARTVDDLGWVSSLLSLRYLDLSGFMIDEHVDWIHPLNMLPSLHILNLQACSIFSIPSISFVNFTSLNSLDLSFNCMNSTIPMWLSNLTGLVHLNLCRNEFHGKIPDFLGMFSSLASIDISSNSFENSIPDMLCNLSSLSRLDLSGNKFSGPIPASLGLLSRLEDLYLKDNHLSGNIPISLGQLSKLKNLDLSRNSLLGVLTENHFSKLMNLNYLGLSWNPLTFNFSSCWIPPFQLQILIASSCNMIGAHFPMWLQTQNNLQRLDLHNSSIRDTMPEWFENILSNIIFLDLSNNQISGKLPSIRFDSGNHALSTGILLMNSNRFEGPLATFPSNVKILDLSDNLLSGHVPQTDGTMNPLLEVVNLSKNRFIGSTAVLLCKVPSIKFLDLSQNKFSGNLPKCLGTLSNLNVLDLTDNNISGVIPSSLGSLQYLNSLHLHNNRFEGDIPASLQNLTGLYTMDLGKNLFMGTIPLWIGEKLSNLAFLDLQSNKFKDKIPLQLCQLKNLQYLSLANNNITGTIPHCFRNLTGMIKTTPSFHDSYFSFVLHTDDYKDYILAMIKGRELNYTSTMTFLTSIDLSGNNIVGEIPDALMHLLELRNLNLSGNLLKGEIPVTIGDLNQLESLDFSLNKLSGRIPQSLTSLHYLSYLNLSFNNLAGPIPIGNQLQTLDDPSLYEGNGGLCGPPVSKSCNEIDVNYNHVGMDHEGQDDLEEWFYAGIGPGFLVGFMGLLGSLHFIKRWRVAYFQTLAYFYAWLTLSILVNGARLRRKVSNMVRL